MMKEPTLIIMAAGMGSRYGGLKQIDPISKEGEIILDFSLYDAMMAGFQKVICVIKKEIEEDFRPFIEGRAAKHINISYAFQELADLPPPYSVPEGRTKPWGTCQAVLACRDLIEGPFAVINADDYYGAGAFHTMYDFLAERAGAGAETMPYEYAMVGYDLENTLTENGSVARGVCRADADGFLAEINERTKISWQGGEIAYTEDEGKTFVTVPKGTPVSMNFWGFTESFMEELKQGFPEFLKKALVENPRKAEYFLPLAVQQLLAEQKAKVKILKSSDKWYGVTYKEDKADVMAAIQSMKDKGLYPEKLWK